MSCTNDKEVNLAKAIEKVKEAAAKRRTDHLLTGVVYITIFLRCGRL